MSDLRPKLALAPGSEQIAADIEAEYGATVLDRQLFPRIVTEDEAQKTERARCSPLHAYMPAYPAEAQLYGIQGGAYAEFSLLPDGRARNPHVTYSVRPGLFDASVRTSLLHSEFAKAPPGARRSSARSTIDSSSRD